MNSLKQWMLGLTVLCSLLLVASQGSAGVEGIVGTVSGNHHTFNLEARTGYITTGEGNSVYMWGYADALNTPSASMQYPGPTLIVTEGDLVTINLSNYLPVDTSIVFPGQNVSVTSDQAGVITGEAPAPNKDGPVWIIGTATYEFTASKPGTYTYYSGTDTGLQVEMGLLGAIIVRPAANSNWAYDHVNTAFDFEYLYVLSEIDDAIHDAVEADPTAPIDMTTRDTKYWLINGRTGPDTLFPSGVPYLPNQPYSAFSQTLPGKDVLVRVVGGGLDLHPFHTHGQNFRILGRDGRMRSSSPTSGADVGMSDFTLTVSPGQTYDAIWNWTGAGLGWDIYDSTTAHTCLGFTVETGTPGDFDPVTHEFCPDHGKPIPVALPQNQFMAFGGFWTGSAFLGSEGELPVGEGGNNPTGGFYFMWHSHNEKELVNFDIAPGGMMTMMAVEPPGTPIQ